MNEHIVHQILHAIWPITVCSVTRLLVSISFKQRGSPQTLGCEDQTYEPQKSSQHSVHSPTPSVTGFETPDSPYEAPNGSRRLVLYQSSSSTTVDQIHPVDPGQCTFLGPRVPTTRKRHLLAMASTLSSDGLHPSSYVVNLESFNCSFQPSCSSKVFPEKRLAAKSLFTKAAFSSPQKTAQPDFGRWSFARASSSRTPKAESVPGCGSLDMGRWFPPGFP